ncbi:autotransporter outer membrane beta-barrel domain-containing protein [Achromobacter xylosoxidans]|nr:autotransporter outer membrane beta-barrel domain-containing protein [Achromobacter xylosoxidans]
MPAVPLVTAFDGTGVNVGVIDNGFEADPAKDHHKTAVAGVLREVIAPEAAEPTDATGAITTHGAMVSRVLAGQSVAGDGFPEGVATGVNLYQANRPSSFTNLTLQNLLTALNARGVRIINNSWSFGTVPALALPDGSETRPDSGTVRGFFPMFVTAVTRNNQLLVWANGNESRDNPYLVAGAPYVMPALERGWLTVTQLQSEGDDLALWSDACGVAANWCLSARTRAKSLTGTSLAAPMVAATAALVAQAYPWMDNSALRQTVLSTADDLGDRARFGWGKLNIERAVRGPALFDTRLTLGGDFVASFDDMRSEFFNDIGGDAGLTKGGTGTLVLWGQNSYAGATTINNGTIELYGSLAGDIAIQPGGALSADGGVSRRSVDNGGTLRTNGNGLHILGDYTAQREANLTTQLGTALTVDGIATLNDSALVVTKPDDAYVVMSRETALKAGEVTGRFGTVTAGAGLLYAVSPDYSASQVDLNVARNDVAEVAQGLYAGQPGRLAAAQAVETAFQAADEKALGADARVSDAFVAGAAQLQAVADATSLAAALDSVSGQIHASSQALAFQQAQTVDRALTDRLDDLAPSGARTGGWVSMIGATGRLRQSGYAGADTRLYGGQAGFDHAINADTVVGIALAWSDAKASFDSYGGRARSQGAGVSLYARLGADQGPYVTARAGHEWIHADVRRDVLVGAAARLDSGRADGLTSLYLEAGHAFAGHGSRLTPFVGLSHDHLRRGVIDEGSHPFALKSGARAYDQSAGLLGLRLRAAPVDWAGGLTTFSAYGAYRYGNPARLDFTAAFGGAPDASFQVEGIGLPRHSGWLGVGASAQLGDALSWFINGTVQFGRGGVAGNGLSAGLRYRFP